MKVDSKDAVTRNTFLGADLLSSFCFAECHVIYVVYKLTHHDFGKGDRERKGHPQSQRICVPATRSGEFCLN